MEQFIQRRAVQKCQLLIPFFICIFYLQIEDEISYFLHQPPLEDQLQNIQSQYVIQDHLRFLDTMEQLEYQCFYQSKPIHGYAIVLKLMYQILMYPKSQKSTLRQSFNHYNRGIKVTFQCDSISRFKHLKIQFYESSIIHKFSLSQSSYLLQRFPDLEGNQQQSSFQGKRMKILIISTIIYQTYQDHLKLIISVKQHYNYFFNYLS
ncbi:unnamed protein product [Paramecium sonneborni]|uniref:Uncharacterized protein n=1 Tax=Paramecium sonneborni TaxID=65129 RepID=A0A8S1KS34_9CILI|nr:unnamed protein product [Paramecium sonneborni]